jgi:hypothetical protein
MTRWRRPHVADLGMATTGALIAVGTLLGIGLLARFALVTREWPSSYIVLPIALGVLWRLHSVGLFTSDRGIRMRTFTRTHTVPWESVRDFESRRATLLGLRLRREAIWVLTDGHAIETPLRQHRGARWDLARRDLSPMTYRATIQRLQNELTERQPDARPRGSAPIPGPPSEID